MNYAVENFIDDLPAPFQVLTRRLQALLLSLDPAMVESFKWQVPFYSYQGLLCYLNPQLKKGHVALGFVHGTRLPDPTGLLTGTGKAIRHVLVRTEADIFQPAVLDLLQAALAANREAGRQRPSNSPR